MEKLTKGEEKIMQLIWDMEEAMVRDVIEKMGDPDTPYTTVSSVMRILEKKGFLRHKAYGKTHVYFPSITKEAYRKQELKRLVSGYFGGSYENIVSFMVEENALSEEQQQDILSLIKEKLGDS